MVEVKDKISTLKVIKRKGKKVDFDGAKIAVAIKKGFDSIVKDDDTENLYDEKVKYNSNKFTFKKNGFTSKIDSTGDTLAIYAIPYDTGWKATNNGKEVQVEKVDNGMMAIKLNKGINDIKFTYMTPGLKSGIIISIISFIIYCLYFYFNYTKKAK